MAEWQPDAALDTLAARAELLAAIRAFFAERRVQEVDTPLLSAAAPSDRQLVCFEVADAGYLVPSPEHALKRLLAAGSGPIYQLGHVFRADEVGRWHNPEFTMLEWYRPGWSMAELMAEVNALLAQVAGASAAPPVDFAALFFEHTGLDAHTASSSDLRAHALARGLAPEIDERSAQASSEAFWLDLIVSLQIAPILGSDAPLCVTGFPAADAVLVAVNEGPPPVAERFEIYWRGVELANGAQELTDADEAERRMQCEQRARATPGQATPRIDTALLAAMRAGLPECAGVAPGVDRLLALMRGEPRLESVLPFAWARR